MKVLISYVGMMMDVHFLLLIIQDLNVKLFQNTLDVSEYFERISSSTNSFTLSIDNQFSSVQRQLNLYGFKCVNRGKDKGAFFHPQFKRGEWEAVKGISRTTGAGVTGPPPTTPAAPVTGDDALPTDPITDVETTTTASTLSSTNATVSSSAGNAAQPIPMGYTMPQSGENTSSLAVENFIRSIPSDLLHYAPMYSSYAASGQFPQQPPQHMYYPLQDQHSQHSQQYYPQAYPSYSQLSVVPPANRSSPTPPPRVTSIPPYAMVPPITNTTNSTTATVPGPSSVSMTSSNTTTTNTTTANGKKKVTLSSSAGATAGPSATSSKKKVSISDSHNGSSAVFVNPNKPDVITIDPDFDLFACDDDCFSLFDSHSFSDPFHHPNSNTTTNTTTNASGGSGSSSSISYYCSATVKTGTSNCGGSSSSSVVSRPNMVDIGINTELTQG